MKNCPDSLYVLRRIGPVVALVALSTHSLLANANLITFRDAPRGNSFCDTSGPGADRSCNSSYKIINGDNDAKAAFEITAHAAADRGPTDGGLFPESTKTATAEAELNWLFDFDVTRTISIEKRGDQYVQRIPQQSLEFEFKYDFRLSVKDEPGSGEEKASLLQLNVRVPSSTSIIPGSTVELDSFGEVFDSDRIHGTINRDYPIPPGTSAGEVSASVQLPTSFELWDDLEAPFLDYKKGDAFQQQFTDFVGVDLRLFARSISKKSFRGGNGGEAFACGGQGADIGNFTGPFSLDNFTVGNVFRDACALEIGFTEDYPLSEYYAADELLPPLPDNLWDPTGFFASVDLVQTGWIERPFSPVARGPVSPVTAPSAFTLVLGGLFGFGCTRRQQREQARVK